MQSVRYGLIGSGMMGQEHIRNIALLDRAEVRAIYEPDDGMAALSLALAPTAQRAVSLSDLLDRSDIDCLLIASPNFCHANQLREIAQRNPLPLLIEKPLFTDPNDAAELAEFERTFPAPIWVAMEYRYMPPIAALLEQAATVTGGVLMLTIREHRFPFLHKVGNWNRFNRYSGGTFVEKCCHFFDLMRLVLQDDPVRVMASAAQSVNHLDERPGGQSPDILDHGYVLVEFAGGARAMLELCMFADGAEYQEEISAVGPRGKIEALVPGPGRFWPSELGSAPVSQLIISPRVPKSPRRERVPVPTDLLDAGDHNGSTFFQHREFLSLMRGERASPAVTLHDGWMAVMMGLCAQHSAASGKAVDFHAFARDPTQTAV